MGYDAGEIMPEPSRPSVTPYGWSAETRINSGLEPLPQAELDAFRRLSETGEPTVLQLDQLMGELGYASVLGMLRAFSLDDFVPSGTAGDFSLQAGGYGNFPGFFTAAPADPRLGYYLLYPALQRYEAAYPSHFRSLQSLCAGLRYDSAAAVGERNRSELLLAYQRMMHLVAASDPGFNGENYLIT